MLIRDDDVVIVENPEKYEDFKKVVDEVKVEDDKSWKL